MGQEEIMRHPCFHTPDDRRRSRTPLIVATAILAAAHGCTPITEVKAPEIEEVVLQDGEPFEPGSMPVDLVERLARHRLVVVGETHFIREHEEMVADLLGALHSRGFRQLLLEWPQAADWLLADFVGDGRLEPDWRPPRPMGGDLLVAVRDLNRSLPTDDRIRVRGIDVNLGEYGGQEMFVELLRSLTRHLSPSEALFPLTRDRHRDPRRYARALEAVAQELDARAAELAEAWGEAWYRLVAEMMEVERASIQIRAVREDHYELSVKLREGLMKTLTDRRLAEHDHGVVLNVGSSHAQKGRLRGTRQEWLGDYLVHQSPVVRGSVFVLQVSPARVVPESGNGTVYFDVEASSPEHELFRTMARTWPGMNVFLPLDDPMFEAGGIAMNFEEVIWVCAPKGQYDGIVVLPLGHRLESWVAAGVKPEGGA